MFYVSFLVHPPRVVCFCCFVPSSQLCVQRKRHKTPAQIPKLHVVDLCCGSGLTSFTLTVATKTVERITAVDRRPEQVMPHFKEVLLDFCLFLLGGRGVKKKRWWKGWFFANCWVFFDYVVLFGYLVVWNSVQTLGLCPSICKEAHFWRETWGLENGVYWTTTEMDKMHCASSAPRHINHLYKI